jgi:hypothetical protein
MRREFTPIGAVSMLIYFLAGVVLCLQVGQSKAVPEWHLPAAVLSILDIAIAGVTVYVWKRGVSLGAWVLGMGTLLVMRLAVSSAAASAFMVLHEGTAFQVASRQISQTLPRICANFFALIVCYPVRSFLPARLLPDRSAPADISAPGGDFVGPGAPGGDAALWFVRGEERIPVWVPGKKERGTGEARPPSELADIEGEVELPLKAILAQVPQEMIGPKAATYTDSHMGAIPLAVIVPQLAEARIVVKLDDLADWLPSGALEVPREALGLDGEPPLVLLPLELVVPHLPESVLELPPPSLPAWAKVAEVEKVSFATI